MGITAPVAPAGLTAPVIGAQFMGPVAFLVSVAAPAGEGFQPGKRIWRIGPDDRTFDVLGHSRSDRPDSRSRTWTIDADNRTFRIY